MPRLKAFPADWETYRAVTPEQLAADKAAFQAAKPLNRVRALLPGESVLLEHYRRSCEVSYILSRISAAHEGRKHRTELERCLGDGSILGVRVTRTK